MEDKTTLTDEEADKALEDLDGWERDGIFIKKDFVFDDFKQINSFLPYFAQTVVDQNHHPDFEFKGGEKKLSMKMTTHSEGGLTQADINLATALNNWS